jgi:NADPH:quinone reductase-like Zn-dependent oxidoreductase
MRIKQGDKHEFSQKHPQVFLLKELVEAGKLKPVIGRRCPFEQNVEAHRYVDRGHKNVMLAIDR